MLYIVVVIFIILVIVAVAAVKLLVKQSNKEGYLPYKGKQNFFSRSEHEFLKVLSEQLDSNRFMIFPKVRLADFIEVTEKGNEYQRWWNKIKSKHIDFLVWDIQNNRISLAIELDGKSHDTEKMKVRDEFVNKLYEQIGVRLERVQVGSDFITTSRNIHDSLS